MKGKQKPYNIADYKAKVVEALVGGKLKDGNDDERIPEHAMVPIPNGERQRCMYCTQAGTTSRTRFMCEGCGVPFCSIGSGRTPQDCFALAHEHEEVRQLCVKNYARKQAHTKRKIVEKR